ncbi:MAG: hypothetical protein ACRC62_33570, partial [Microcoleus sp.]
SRLFSLAIGHSAFQSDALEKLVFSDCSIRDYWDEQNSLMVDRDLNAAINLKRLGLDIFPSIKRAQWESFCSRNYR